MRNHILLAAGIGVALLAAEGPAVFADVTLEVQVARGGFDLDFGNFKASEGSRTETPDTKRKRSTAILRASSNILRVPPRLTWKSPTGSSTESGTLALAAR